MACKGHLGVVQTLRGPKLPHLDFLRSLIINSDLHCPPRALLILKHSPWFPRPILAGPKVSPPQTLGPRPGFLAIENAFHLPQVCGWQVLLQALLQRLPFRPLHGKSLQVPRSKLKLPTLCPQKEEKEGPTARFAHALSPLPAHHGPGPGSREDTPPPRASTSRSQSALQGFAGGTALCPSHLLPHAPGHAHSTADCPKPSRLSRRQLSVAASFLWTSEVGVVRRIILLLALSGLSSLSCRPVPIRGVGRDREPREPMRQARALPPGGSGAV